MNYVGDFPEDQTVYIPFNTFDSNDPSASVTITNLIASDVEVWKDGVVQTTPGAGVTITLNIGTNNGTHLIAVDTSNTADGGFYVTSADYQVRINGTTIDGAAINAWVGSFSTENRFMRGTDGANTTVPDAAGVAPTVGEIQTEMEENGASVLDTIRDALANGVDGLSALKTLIDAIPTTMVGTDNAALATVLGAAVGASISADIADIPTVSEFNARSIASADYTIVSDLGTVQSGDSFARIGVAGAGLTDITVNAASVTAIWAKAMSDLAQGAPSATASVLVAINYLYEAWRNKTTTTATLITMMKDNGTTAAVKSTISDDSTTFTKEEFISGA